ncbi:hypothetical protein STAS_21572 [Striga asiatica]|uniref:DUF7081 domain-containing protein n=1 Tax=Striga asiatica TaxID=4170 RepID=A0A5A7QI98_STRAF|nr:hypothetical protein STAS_21572 [Striga asiatica]
MEKDGTSPLSAVPPKASGEGLPYAPVDWPSPGDVWTWKVGNKISSSGLFMHRFLIVPKRLQKNSSRKIWLGSKKAVIHFLQSEFPEADVDKFFELFTWEIPAEVQTARKDKRKPSRKRPSMTDTPPKEVETGSRISKRTRKKSAKTSIQFPPTVDNNTPSSTDVPLLDYTPHDLSTDNLISNIPDNNPEISTSPAKEAPVQPELNLLPHDSRSLADYLAEMTQEDFEFYLNSLDDTLSDSGPKGLNPSSSGPQTDDDFTKARKHLSSLLAMGFSSLVSSDNLPEITNLTLKLQLDPNLTPEELSMLNLVREIPLAGKDFLEARRVAEQASNFFSELGAKRSRIKERKNEFIQSKGKIVLLQAEVDSASAVIREIDEQIAVLQSRRAVLTAVIKTNEKRIADLVCKQKGALDCVPRIVNDVQVANSERSVWESKRKESARKEKEILAKFGPVGGFSFVR